MSKTSTLREALAKTVAANVLAKYTPVFPHNFYDLTDQILRLLKEHGMVFKSNEDGEPEDLHFVEELDLKEKE